MASDGKTKSRRSAQRTAVQSQPRQSAPVAQVKEPANESAWHERAVFQVAFDHALDTDGQPIWQTRAYHEEADGRTIWPGIAGAALTTWMHERADLPPEIQASNAPIELVGAQALAADDHNTLQITIDQLSLEAALTEQHVGGAPNEPRLDARISFHLSGVPAYPAAANESSYLIQLFAHDPAQNHVAVLALEGQQLQPELLEYHAVLSFETPPVGEYQIMALVLLPEQAVSATELGPVLTVVP